HLHIVKAQRTKPPRLLAEFGPIPVLGPRRPKPVLRRARGEELRVCDLPPMHGTPVHAEVPRYFLILEPGLAEAADLIGIFRLVGGRLAALIGMITHRPSPSSTCRRPRARAFTGAALPAFDGSILHAAPRSREARRRRNSTAAM